VDVSSSVKSIHSQKDFDKTTALMEAVSNCGSKKNRKIFLKFHNKMTRN